MIKRLKELFKTSSIAKTAVKADETQIALAALLIEAATSDAEYSDPEREMISVVLQRHFLLSHEDAETVIKNAETEHAQSHQLLYFTRTIKDSFSIEDRVEIVEMLWEIAYADGELSQYEANLVRRICGLIYVDDVESGKAKKRVLQALNTP